MFIDNESLGICLGASTITLVRMRKTAGRAELVWARTQCHEGNPRLCLERMLRDVADLGTLRVAATGRKSRNRIALATIAEPEAVELAAAHLLEAGHPYRAIVSAGGESFMVYHFDDDGRIQNIHAGSKCASGTGEFFLQQLGRMDVTLAEAGCMAVPETPHKVSGRCSVFCKSDCTHALNKGVPKSHVVAGLTKMMAGKLVELLQKLPKTPIVLIGGCAANHSMVHHLREAVADLHVPEEAPYFEALGAALWAMDHDGVAVARPDRLFVQRGSSLSFLKPLSDYRDRVDFKQRPQSTARAGDVTILGLDVGSTTTKGVIMRRRDKAILAADYLRTNGDPVGASRRVYASLREQIAVPIEIEGLGVTGSGRQIAGLHAMTDGVINEIIAHAAAAVHFDADVDTIFEIGGQDAKYTYITNGVPSDYAMNEACSAGTGSFLEESAKESLGLDVSEIGPTAYQATSPPNFNDQCAAFIGSDIKGAVQDGVSVPDIVAGLVYSVCMNYINRVKGNRPVGRKVFLQGGVCYNEAIPAAMAALTGKRIVVPPQPGLMGAFGVALALEQRMEKGLLEPAHFDLGELAAREVAYGEPFICRGGKEKCDRACEIARVRIDGKVYPFGGICNRYDNLIHHREVETDTLDLVVQRQRRVFRDLAPEKPHDTRPTVAMNRSFLVNTYFPFYNRFFAELGFRTVLPDTVRQEGVDRQGAAFCYPAELAHGYAADILAKKPDYVFLPHVTGIPSGAHHAAQPESSSARVLPATTGTQTSCTCVFVQGEPFYLRTAFPALDGPRTLTPHLDLSKDMAFNLDACREVARQLGTSPERGEAALEAALAEQDSFFADIRGMGRKALEALHHEPQRLAVALFGRPYNSFAPEANKGIPAKFASRSIAIIPFDMLPCQDEELEPDHNMYWAMGRQILKGAHYVARHPQLFAAYVTNFSCGPDSFVVGYFRDIMGRKPSLTLELDSHTADAGIETRIEAFLDIAQFYRQTQKDTATQADPNGFRAARMEMRDMKAGVRTSSGSWLPLAHPRVKVVLPAMGRHGTALVAKAFQVGGIRTEVLPPADEEVLKLGRGNSSCKECLPLQTTLGSMLHYMARRPDHEVTAYFMGTTDGPCRFGQYQVLSKRVIQKHRIPDAAVLSLTCTNGYGGLGDRLMVAAWRAVVIGDVLDEVWSTVLAGAVDRAQGLEVLRREHGAILAVIHKGWRALARQLSASAEAMAGIRLERPYHEIPKVSLVGEIYVRNDPISLQNLVERMADQGFIVRTSHNSEWIKYLDWLTKKGIEGETGVGFWIRHHIKRHFDRKIRKRLAPSGLFFHHDADVEPVLDAGGRFISPRLGGEAILTVGAALHEILEPSCGVISIGPFGCMPSRVAEAVLSEAFTTTVKRELADARGHLDHLPIMSTDRKLPFLAIETDANTFPQVIEARLEAFCLQARRINDMIVRHAAKATP